MCVCVCVCVFVSVCLCLCVCVSLSVCVRRCQYSHLDWTRRSPEKFDYQPRLCPHVTLTPTIKNGRRATVATSTCPYDKKCPLAHTVSRAAGWSVSATHTHGRMDGWMDVFARCCWVPVRYGAHALQREEQM